MARQSEIDAKTPDSFLTASEQGLRWVENNIKLVVGVLAIALFAGLGWAGMAQWKLFTERKAADAIYKAQAKLNAKKDEISKAENEALTSKPGEKSKTPPKVDFETTFAEPAHEVEVAIIAHHKTRTASVAAIDLASLYLSYKKPDLATALLNQVDGADSDTLKTLIQALSATAAFEQADFARATSIYEQILQEPKSEYMHPQALLKLGLCYEKQDQWDRAKEMYTRASTEFSDSESGRTAKGYLRLLELQGKKG